MYSITFFFIIDQVFLLAKDRLVQNLSSGDANDVSKAMQESDKLLKDLSKTGVDRTVINKSTSDQQPQISPGKRKINESDKHTDTFLSRCIYVCIRKRCS